MKRASVALLALCLLSAPAWADDKEPPKKEPDEKQAVDKKPAEKAEVVNPVEILKKADAACSKIKTVSYDLVIKVTGVEAQEGREIKASVILSGFENGTVKRSYVDIHAPEQGSETAIRHITGGSDGEMFYVIDHKAKKAYEDMDPQVIGVFARFVNAPVFLEFMIDNPFRDEIKGKKHEFKGMKTINGEECYEIRVEYDTPQFAAATWCISKKDFLPRARIDEFKLANGRKAFQHKTLSKVVPEPKVTKETFQLKLPEGYTKTDEFAE